MTEALVVLGSFVCLIGLCAIILPTQLVKAVKRIKITTPLRFLASFLRILFGCLLLLVADSTRFPLTLKIIGILLIVAGVVVLLTGNARIQSILDWVLRRSLNTIRIGGAGGLLFGGFLIYAAV